MPFKDLAFAAGRPRWHGNPETLLDWLLCEMVADHDMVIEKMDLTYAEKFGKTLLVEIKKRLAG